jgi:hypothetical protein
MQLVPAQVVNPPSKEDLPAPPEVEQTLRRSCYDCHSNQTHWPWYSRIAPLSWIVARDVNAGRRQLNFSEWGEYFPATRRRKLQWMERALGEEAMPPWTYRAMHPSSRLAPADRAELRRWIETQLASGESGR